MDSNLVTNPSAYLHNVLGGTMVAQNLWKWPTNLWFNFRERVHDLKDWRARNLRLDSSEV